MEKPTQSKLDEMLAMLPRDVEAPRDLWPRIAATMGTVPPAAGAQRPVEVGRRRRTRRTYALAASVAMVCVTGALTWASLHGRAQRSGVNETRAGAGSLSFEEPRNAAYLEARAELQRAFQGRLSMLDPRTRSKIETNLAALKRTHEELRRALAEQPANPVLERLYQSTWHDEFDLYDSVVKGTQPASKSLT